nr:hypothetical protein [Tanacetum cinerariifolium]
MIDYSLWEVIENAIATPITNVVEGVETIISPTTVKEKADRRLELKAIEKRFRENAATKKTQRNLLKQHYENFTAYSLEVLDQTFDRLQKLISQLKIHDESILQEDVNQKFLRRSTSGIIDCKEALNKKKLLLHTRSKLIYSLNMISSVCAYKVLLILSPSLFLSGALFQPHGERDISSSFSMHYLSS